MALSRKPFFVMRFEGTREARPYEEAIRQRHNTTPKFSSGYYVPSSVLLASETPPPPNANKLLLPQGLSMLEGYARNLEGLRRVAESCLPIARRDKSLADLSPGVSMGGVGR